MYIKIKQIKYFLLISSCIFFAGVNYLSYVKADVAVSNDCKQAIDADCDQLTDSEEKLYGTSSENADTDGDGYSDGVEVKSGYNPIISAPGDKISSPIATSETENNATNSSVTDTFSQNLSAFIASKENQTITSADINDFASRSVSASNSQITFEDLPQIEEGEIIILPQNYNNLSDSDKKKKMQQDALQYYYQIMYILASNTPIPIITDEDSSAFIADFMEHYATMASTSPDTEYFTDIATRLDASLEQIYSINVPESMVGMHTKALRITKGFLSLRDMDQSFSDPLEKIIMLSKIQNLTEIAADFFENDFTEYNNSLR